ncbi:MAG: TRAP transporter small permease subunit [Desulfovibrio desulfuricans]|jgi:TRAP-type mannitol/chloroaromatic compound transport system permease small subunit|nr:TRAP transporter small permease subunit [Desulfovibrio desulfuricans]
MGFTYEQAMAQVPPWAHKTISFFDRISGFVGKAASWLCVPMIGFLICEVFLRYGFNKPTVWANDLTVLCYGIMYMLASPYCLRDGGHVRTDFFYHNWSVRAKALSDMAHYILFFYPAHIIFLYVGWKYFAASFAKLESSPESSWGMWIWPAKAAIVVYIVLTMTQGFSELLKCWYRFKTRVELWQACPEADDQNLSAAENKPGA